MLTPSMLVKYRGNNSPRGCTKAKGAEQTPPSIYTGCIWTALAPMLAVGASRDPQHSVPLTDRTMSSASPSPGDMGVGTRRKQTVCAPPGPELWNEQRHGGSWEDWRLYPLAPETPSYQAGPWYKQGGRATSYLDNSVHPGSVSTGEWATQSFPLRVKAPGRLMAVKGAG